MLRCGVAHSSWCTAITASPPQLCELVRLAIGRGWPWQAGRRRHPFLFRHDGRLYVAQAISAAELQRCAGRSMCMARALRVRTSGVPPWAQHMAPHEQPRALCSPEAHVCLLQHRLELRVPVGRRLDHPAHGAVRGKLSCCEQVPRQWVCWPPADTQIRRYADTQIRRYADTAHMVPCWPTDYCLGAQHLVALTGPQCRPCRPLPPAAALMQTAPAPIDLCYPSCFPVASIAQPELSMNTACCKLSAVSLGVRHHAIVDRDTVLMQGCAG
jgi:hypothetical protein